jgi:hypothetical protein
MALPAQALQGVQLSFKAFCNEGHFILKAETVFHLYLPKDFSGVAD